MDAMKVKKLGLGLRVQDLSVKNEKYRRIAHRASRMDVTMNKLNRKLKGKNRRVRVLTKNLTALKAELETLCLHIYKMDSMLVTTTTSMERILKVHRFKPDKKKFLSTRLHVFPCKFCCIKKKKF